MIETERNYNECLTEMDFANPDNTVLFNSSEEAWFWFCKYNERRDGYKRESSANTVIRPCFLDDVYIVVSRLFLSGKITKKDLDVLVKYGKKQIAPDIRTFEEYEDALSWQDSMRQMTPLFIQKKIVRESNLEI